jgi:hypothetical protein
VEPRDADRVAFLHGAHTRTDPGHDADALMPRNKR